MDEIADGAGVAKGAVYHHFKTKEAVFEAVFDQVSRDLVAEIDGAARAEKDVLAAMVAGTQHYFAATAKGPTGQIILRDGPAVLGWERWREIDAQHFGGKMPRALSAAMEAGLIARQPVEPLARLLLGAVTEAGGGAARRCMIVRSPPASRHGLLLVAIAVASLVLRLAEILVLNVQVARTFRGQEAQVLRSSPTCSRGRWSACALRSHLLDRFDFCPVAPLVSTLGLEAFAARDLMGRAAWPDVSPSSTVPTLNPS
jgi:AcrR family transcriptional regulator